MKTFALLDKNNLVINISIADDDWHDDNWMDITGRECAIGFTYNVDENIFIAPQPFPSWSRNGSYWVAPKAVPDDNNFYGWDESLGVWVAN